MAGRYRRDKVVTKVQADEAPLRDPKNLNDATPWAEEVLAKVEDMYFKHIPVKTISLETGVPTNTIHSWGNTRKWPAKRKLMQTEAIKEITEKKKGHLLRITDLCVEGLEKVVEAKVRGGKNLDMQDAKFFASIIGDIEKVYRLTMNQATDIKEDRQISTQLNLTDKTNIMKVINNDPMVSLKNLQIEEKEKGDEVILDAEFSDEPEDD
jgi:uncharacterized protein YjcR